MFRAVDQARCLERSKGSSSSLLPRRAFQRGGAALLTSSSSQVASNHTWSACQHTRHNHAASHAQSPVARAGHQAATGVKWLCVPCKHWRSNDSELDEGSSVQHVMRSDMMEAFGGTYPLSTLPARRLSKAPRPGSTTQMADMRLQKPAPRGAARRSTQATKRACTADWASEQASELVQPTKRRQLATAPASRRPGAATAPRLS